MTRERGILFSAPMVRAILEGRKTVTRRVVNRVASLGPVSEFGRSDTPGYDWHCRDRRALWNDLREAELLARCPYGQVGDRLYVRERFKPIASGQVKHGYGEVRYGYAYEADGATRWNERPTIIHDLTGQPSKGPMQFRPSPWRAAVTMPHRAARIWLEVTAVRVERLQDITEDSAEAEGVAPRFLCEDDVVRPTPPSPARAGPKTRGCGWWSSNESKRRCPVGAAEDLHAPFDEAEAARRLGVSKATLMRERAAGKIHPMRIGQRVIRYTETILHEYREACRNAPAKSANTGSAKGRAPISGAAPGSTPTVDKRDAHRLAQTIFKKRS